MLRTKTITKNMKDFNLFKNLFYTAFPKSEQVPVGVLLSNAKSDKVSFDAYYDGNIFVGFTYILTYEDLTYLFYFAIRSDIRSKGYGTQILSHIKKTYPNQRLVLNCDAEDETAADNEVRKKRKDFYFKNGYSNMDFTCKMNGNHLEILTHSCDVTPEEFQMIFKKFWGRILFTFLKPKIIKKQ